MLEKTSSDALAVENTLLWVLFPTLKKKLM